MDFPDDNFIRKLLALHIVFSTFLRPGGGYGGGDLG